MRRGRELGFQYGFELSRRTVKVKGGEFALVKYQAILSPPPMRAGQPPMSAEAAKNYKPISDVLVLPDAEVLVRREPGGFTDGELEKILAAITVTPSAR